MNIEFKDYVANIVDAIEKKEEFTQNMGFLDFEKDYWRKAKEDIPAINLFLSLICYFFSDSCQGINFISMKHTIAYKTIPSKVS